MMSSVDAIFFMRQIFIRNRQENIDWPNEFLQLLCHGKEKNGLEIGFIKTLDTYAEVHLYRDAGHRKLSGMR